MKDLNIALVQTDLYWENPEANRANIEEMLTGVDSSVDLILLPETFTTGFSMNTGTSAEQHNLHTVKWMTQQAALHDCIIAGSIIVKDAGKFFNRLYIIDSNGILDYYDKRHLFSLSDERANLSSGNRNVIVKIRDWNVAFYICYDLRFPVWSRNVGNAIDTYVFVANWPSQRSHIWKTLLSARAIENGAYAVGVNRLGKDGNDLIFDGQSGIYFADGHSKVEAGNAEGVYIFALSAEELKTYREQYPFYKDADPFELK